MAGFGAPVAQEVNASPQQGLQTISQLLGLQQQKLGIARQQIGLSQAQQQLSSETSAAAQAAIHTQNMQQLQSQPWQQLYQSGGLDAVAQRASQVGGVDAPEFIGRFAHMEQAGAEAKKAAFSLNQTYLEPIRSTLAAWAGDPKGELPDLQAALEGDVEAMPKSEQGAGSELIQKLAPLFAGPNLISGQPKSLQQQKAEALLLARAGLTTSETAGPGGLATPIPGQQNLGGQIVPTAQSRLTGAITHPSGAIGTTISPTIVTQPGTGAPAIVGPTGNVTPIGGTSGAPGSPGGAGGQQGTNWWQPGAGQVQLLTANTAALAGRIQAGEKAANSSPTAIDALERSRAILDQGVQTGGAFATFKDMKNLLASMGVDTTDAQNSSELAKNLARYEAARAGSVGDTDAARSLYEAGAPNTKMDAKAVKAVVLQSLGIEKMIQGYAKAVGGAATPQQAMKIEQEFRSVPHLVQAYELGFMRNQAEANEFFKRYDISGRTLAESAAKLRKLGAL